MRLNHLITIGLISVASGLFSFAGVSNANPLKDELPAPTTTQESMPSNPDLQLPPNKDDTFYRIFFHYGGDYYDQVGMGSQLNAMFGWNAFSGKWKALPLGAYPENQIMENAAIINTVYHDFLFQQTSSDPLVQTRDLQNPFDSSLKDNPCYTRLSGQPCSTR